MSAPLKSRPDTGEHVAGWRQSHVVVKLRDRSFQGAMGELARGVCIAATGDGDDRDAITTTSVSMLSAQGGKILMCLPRSATMCVLLERCRVFAVSVLGSHHRQLARSFVLREAGRPEVAFSQGCWRTLSTGAPILCDALSAVDCEVEELLMRAEQVIVIGKVVAVRAPSAGHALLRWRGQFECASAVRAQSDVELWAPIL